MSGHPTSRAERRALREKLDAPASKGNLRIPYSQEGIRRSDLRKADRAALREAAAQVVSWVPSRW